EIVQCRGADDKPRTVRLIPLRDPRVEIPAVIIEPCGVSDLAYVDKRLVLELPKSDDDVGDLDTEIVDVVLHLDGRPAEAKRAHERVAERCVTKMADVRCLVWVEDRKSVV